MKKNMLAGQSGGPTAVINASLYGVVKEGLERRRDEIGKVYGMVNGIEGFLNDNYLDMAEEFTEETLELLKTTPASYLGSCRYKLPESLEDPVYPLLLKKLEALQIGYVFYIGGNDSMDTVSKLSRYFEKAGSDIRMIGVPKTIDNDLVETDHTPGFGSAAKYVASTVREIAVDAAVYETEAVTIVEIMGRHAGWLTAASALARQFEGDNPVLIYLPEVDFDEDVFVEQVKEALKTKKALVVCVSEGIHNSDGTFVCEAGKEVATDNFGHKMLTGCGKYLENMLKSRLGIKVRSVELNVLQRACAAQISAVDSGEAVEAGRTAVKSALEGKTGLMVAFERVSENPYRMECSLKDVNAICNKEKTVPLEWIAENHADVTEAFVQYAMPLIQGNMTIPTENGLPKFAVRKKQK